MTERRLERRLVWVTGAFIVVAGTLLHFCYDWSGRNRLVGLLAPVSESVWEHTKLLVVPVLVAGLAEAFLLPSRRLVAWATLAECVAGALAIPAIFYAYTGALGTGPVLWVDIGTFVAVVAAGQWLHLRVLTGAVAPPAAVSVLGIVLLVGIYVAWTLAPPGLPLFQA